MELRRTQIQSCQQQEKQILIRHDLHLEQMREGMDRDFQRENELREHNFQA